MRIKQITTALTKPRILAPTVFLAVGTGKTVADYQNASKEKKRRVLLKDTAMLLGSAVGFIAISPLTKYLCKGSNIKNTILKNTEFVFTQSIGATLNMLAGITGAVFANKFAHKHILNKPYFTINEGTPNLAAQSKVFQKFSQVNKQVIQTSAGAIFSMPNMTYFSAPMVALTGMSVAKADGYNNQIKRTAKELISSALIPTMSVSLMSLLVHNKKSYVKYPALLISLIAGSLAGNEVADRYSEKIGKTVDSVSFKGLSSKKS